jgi:hypothetical protein
MTRLPLLLVLAALAFPASAAAKTCHTKSDYEAIKVHNVSCKRGKKIMKKYFAGDPTPYGYTCSVTQYEGGVTTKCRKGDKRVTHLSAD